VRSRVHPAVDTDHHHRCGYNAQEAGDKDLVVFFREAQGTQALPAERAKGLLGISGAPAEVDATPETSREPGRGMPPGTAAPRTPPDMGG
jgi:hypothetical protein